MGCIYKVMFAALLGLGSQFVMIEVAEAASIQSGDSEFEKACLSISLSESVPISGYDPGDPGRGGEGDTGSR
ncbi:MAG: hypothetical protein ACRC8A_00415 [Microcoleaceae cyanobacterium]